MFLVCLVSFTFLDINTADLLSNMMRGFCSQTIYGYLLITSLFSMMKFAKFIHVVHASLCSLSSLDWETGPGTCVK